MSAAGRRVGLGLAARGDVRDTVAWAANAEHLGFESIWVHDSYFERDPITYLAAIAQETNEIGIAAGALNPITRNPVVLAMTGSALDDLAPGRLSMALGSGLPLRLAQMDIPFNLSFKTKLGFPVADLPDQDTVSQVSRAIDIVRTLWAGERLTLNPNVPPLQPMFQPPHRIPIYIAGYQRKFLDLCGEKADGYLARPAESIPAFRLIRARVREVAAQHNRNPDDIEFRG